MTTRTPSKQAVKPHTSELARTLDDSEEEIQVRVPITNFFESSPVDPAVDTTAFLGGQRGRG